MPDTSPPICRIDVFPAESWMTGKFRAESERRLLLAIARDFSAMCHLQGWDGSEAEIMKLVAAVEAENAHKNAKSPARDTTGGAGGGDPLPKKPEQENAYWAVQMAKCWQETLDENTQLKADLARLSLVHQATLTEIEAQMRYANTWNEGFTCGCLTRVRDVLLAASTTETPP